MTTATVLGSNPGLSARALASRRNGARSRGPKTAAGKARSAQNAIKHGLCAKKLLVLPKEDLAEFQALEAALLAELGPEGALQSVLAQRVVSAAWRLMRADRIEADVLAFRSDPSADLGIAVIRDGNTTRSVETVLRYRNGATTEFLRALKTLQALQAEARTHAGLSAAPSRERRASSPLAGRNEPEQPRQINGSAANPVLDRRPAASASKTATPRVNPRPARRSPAPDGPDVAPMPVAGSRAGAKRTREGVSNQHLDPRASQRSAA
jgi:hypothetical protein